VLDIGCGSGQTTRQAAAAAGSGSAHGVDVRATAIDRARKEAVAQGLRNVSFEVADAQVHPFEPQYFDLAMSRFGTMFFADPVAAFANVVRALRPAGRLVMMVWQSRALNEWAVAIQQSLEEPESSQAEAAAGADAFSLGDPLQVKEILEAAGFAGVGFADVCEPVYYGPDVAAALDWVGGFTSTSQALKRLEPAQAARATARLRETLAARLTNDGVWFDSRAWSITAVRRPQRNG
jgi:ubiquinone/menaquinone biosynthesis C-methylase UbiE